MNKNAEANNSQTEELPSPEKILDSLSGRFKRGEMPRDLDNLREMAESIGAKGKEHGFNNYSSDRFVDVDGNLIMISRKEGEERSSYAPPAEDKTCRIFVDGTAIEVVIPPDWQRHTLQFSNGEQAADVIYDLEGVDVASLPDDMRRLVDKFGTELRIEATTDSEQARFVEGIAVGLDDVEERIAHQEEVFKKAEEEAHRIEDEAAAAAKRVKKKLFMSARKLAALQNEAYRDSIQKSTGKHHY